eukprot:1092372-Prymnesium_polylepis.1
MAGKGRETWQLGAWRARKFVRSCVTARWPCVSRTAGGAGAVAGCGPGRTLAAHLCEKSPSRSA